MSAVGIEFLITRLSAGHGKLKFVHCVLNGTRKMEMKLTLIINYDSVSVFFLCLSLSSMTLMDGLFFLDKMPRLF